MRRRSDHDPASRRSLSARRAGSVVSESTARRGSYEHDWRRDIAVPLAIRLLEMLVQVLAVAVLNEGSGRSLAGRFTIWDSRLYAQIVSQGYPHRILFAPNHTLSGGNNLAFLPGYPVLVWAVHKSTRLGVLPSELLVSIIASCAFSVLVHALARAGGGTRREGYLACALVGLLPAAVVLQMGYAEATFAAFSAGALLAAYRGRWLLAGILASAAGLTRPLGYLALVPALVLGIERRTARDTAGAGPSWPRLAAVGAIGLASTVGYWAFVAARTGRPSGWFTVEVRGWGTRIDGGRTTIEFLRRTLEDPAGSPGLAVCVVVILAGLLGVLAAIADREAMPFVALGLAVALSVVLTSNFWHSKPRLLLGGALVVVPVARRLGALPLRRLAPLLGLGLGLSCWFGAYLITQWPYAI